MARYRFEGKCTRSFLVDIEAESPAEAERGFYDTFYWDIVDDSEHCNYYELGDYVGEVTKEEAS